MPFEPTLEERLRGLVIRQADMDERYLAAYPVFRDFFENNLAITAPTANSAKVGVHLVYTWMGRSTLDPACLERAQAALALLPDARAGQLSTERLVALAEFVGGSIIATSKFLHFLNPEHFAIWDQHVARAAYGFSYHAQYANAARYQTYLADIREWTLPQDARGCVEEALPANVSELRKKEFALFHLGISELQP